MVYFIQNIVYFFLHLPFKFFLKGSIEFPPDLQKSDFQPPLIVIANHHSRIDPFLLLLLPYGIYKKLTPIYFLTAEHYYNKWWLKPLIRILGAYPIKKLGWTMEDFFDNILKKLQEGKNIMIFPEGVRVSNPQNSKAKPGVAYLAVQSKAKLLPLQLQGNLEVTLFNFLLRKCPVKITLGKSFSVQDEVAKDYATQSKQILEHVYSL